VKESEKELAKQLYETRNDPSEWGPEESDIEVRPKGTEVVSFRLPSEELDKVIEAAKTAGESLSQFIRGSLALRVHGKPIGPAVEISSGHGKLVIRSLIVVDSKTENPSIIPDFPPEGQSVDFLSKTFNR